MSSTTRETKVWTFTGVRVVRFLRGELSCKSDLQPLAEALVRVDSLVGARPPSRLTFQQVSRHRWVCSWLLRVIRVFLSRVLFSGWQCTHSKLVSISLYFECGWLFVIAFVFPAFSPLWCTSKVFLSAHFWCGTFLGSAKSFFQAAGEAVN